MRKTLMDLSKKQSLVPTTLYSALFAVFITILGVSFLSSESQATAPAQTKSQEKSISPRKSTPSPTLDKQQLVEAFIQSFYSQTPIVFDNLMDAPMKGNPQAKTQIVVFSDYECPYCKKGNEILQNVLEEYKNEVVLFEMHYPLDQSCNPYVSRAIHKTACLAAEAAMCAEEQGFFWEFHNDLFAHQGHMSSDQIVKSAQNLGLKMPEFKACQADGRGKTKVLDNIEEGHKAGINGTPSVFVNGRPLKGWNNIELFKEILNREIAKP